MKKIIATFLMMITMAMVMPFAASAQTRYNSPRYRTYTTRTYGTRGYVYDNRSFYEKHRNKLNVAIGTGAGALLGGLIGGKRGALAGSLLGAGGSALYTYKLRNHRY
jgi:outer membrane lipoprotein SlyB